MAQLNELQRSELSKHALRAPGAPHELQAEKKKAQRQAYLIRQALKDDGQYPLSDMNRYYLIASSLLLMKLTDIGMQEIENRRCSINKMHDTHHHNDEIPDRPTDLPKYKRPVKLSLSATYVVVPPKQQIKHY